MEAEKSHHMFHLLFYDEGKFFSLIQALDEYKITAGDICYAYLQTPFRDSPSGFLFNVSYLGKQTESEFLMMDIESLEEEGVPTPLEIDPLEIN